MLKSVMFCVGESGGRCSGLLNMVMASSRKATPCVSVDIVLSGVVVVNRRGDSFLSADHMGALVAFQQAGAFPLPWPCPCRGSSTEPL